MGGLKRETRRFGKIRTRRKVMAKFDSRSTGAHVNPDAGSLQLYAWVYSLLVCVCVRHFVGVFTSESFRVERHGEDKLK